MNQNLKKLQRLGEKIHNQFVRRIGLNLTGYCAKASYRLHQHANKLGIKTNFCIGYFNTCGQPQNYFLCDNHAWIEYKQYIIDITATQFDETYPGVLITRKPSILYTTLFIGDEAECRLISDWVLEQIPYEVKMKRGLIKRRKTKAYGVIQ